MAQSVSADCKCQTPPLVGGLGARGPEFDSRISHPCFDSFPFPCS